jgi:hypothetical protein
VSTHTPIASQTLSSAAASVTFSNIPQTYTDLVLVCNIAQVASNNSLRIRYNSDTGSNYSYTQLQGDGSSAVSGRDSNLTSGLVAETTASTSLDLAVIAHIQNYSNTTTYKTLIGRGNRVSSLVDATASLWRSTAAITTIDLAMGSGFPANNFSSGSTFNLYGIANASITNTAKATGGDSVTTDGTYWYHTFRTSGTFTPTETLTADYLVVAGGAGGGAGINADGNGGGGGAGGLRCTVQATGGGGSLPSALSLTAQAYTVTVGAGGAAATSGSNSVFSSITSTGGGTGGKTGGTNSGASGGSGGGVYNDGAGTGSVGSGTADEGFNGAKSSPTAPYFGGGGGGAGEAGNTDARGDGGDGISTNISGSSVNYAGGGGGGVNAQSATSTGGTGGGGNGGSNNTLAQSGTVNTGGAGGGGAAHTSFIAAGAGGSGIVIVRYAV